MNEGDRGDGDPGEIVVTKQDILIAKREDVATHDGHETKVSARGMGVSARYSFSGPLPPPEVFAKYEKAFRGAGGRILSMAEDHAKHRRELERTEQAALIRDDARGQWMGFSIVIAAMVIGAYMITEGAKTEGVVAFFTGLASLFGAVILRKLEEHRERKKQEKIEAESKKGLPPAS